MTEESTSQRTTVTAFYSSADGSGRSCMVANLALMLACQGQRVLVVDLDHAAPALHRYLSAFLPAVPSGDTTNLPVRLSCDFDHPAGAVDFIGPVTDAVPEPGQFTVSRADLRERGYDIVLIDLPASAEAAVLAGDLADILVLGYTLNKQHMDRAAQLAQQVGTRVRVLPVPMRVDRNAGQATAQQRKAGHRQFTWLLGHLPEEERQHYWNDIEIPYEPEYAVEEGLPFLDPPSAHRDRLVAAYQRLARQLAPTMPEATGSGATSQTLRRYRQARQAAADQNTTVVILYAAEDRQWGEWITATLASMGFTAIRRRIDQFRADDAPGSSKLIVVSAHLLRLPGVHDLLQRVADLTQQDGQAPVSVSVDHKQLPDDLFRTLGQVSLRGKSAKQASEALASYYQIVGSPLPTRDQVRYPARRELTAVNLPARGQAAIGRDDLIDVIRDHFTARPASQALALTGLAGMGKTLVALEYARRFGADYDLIAFIQADSAESLRADLANLAARVPPQRPTGDAVAALFDELRPSGTPARRWLLIYAGADDPSLLRGYLPESGHAHVLLTSRELAPEGAVRLEVPPLAEADAKVMLSEQFQDISAQDAAWVAGHMRGIPLALRLTCTWLQVAKGAAAESGADLATLTEDAVLTLQSKFADRTGGADALVADPVEPLVGLHLDGLTGSLGNAARLLLETCAFLGNSGLSWRLLRSSEMLAQLAAASPELIDPIVLPSVIHLIASHGLLLLDDTTLIPGELTQAPLRVHPRVLAVVRGQLTEDERAERERQVSKMLAASAPQGVDDDVITSGGIYAELLQHVYPSGAIDQLDDTARRWLVSLVRFLWQTDNHSSRTAAGELGERLAARWLALLPSGDREPLDDPLLLQLRTQLANVYRSLGEFDRARELDMDVLVRQRRVLGVRHPRTLATARSYAADLRLVGDFMGALLEDSAIWQAIVQAMGREHLQAIIASGNLALSELLYGDVEQALRRRLDHDLPWCERFDDTRPWETAWVLSHVGALQRELGRYEASFRSLMIARDGFNRSTGKAAPASSEQGLRVEAGIAIAQRRLGRPDPEANAQILDECRKNFGDAHPLVATILLSQAGDAWETGNPAEAVALAEQALTRHIRCFTDDHPFTWINQVDLSIYALAAGFLERAEEMSQAALSALDGALGDEHLWTLAASVARANVLAVTGRAGDAIALEKKTEHDYKKRLGADHPFTQAATANLNHSYRLRNEPGPTGDLVDLAAQRNAIELDIPPH